MIVIFKPEESFGTLKCRRHTEPPWESCIVAVRYTDEAGKHGTSQANEK